MRNLLLSISIGLFVISCASPVPAPGPAPELVLYGGLVYTQDGGKVVPAIALCDGRVLAYGTDASMRGLATGQTREIDLQGRTVYPGFADAHAHLLGIGMAAQRLDLVGTTTFEEVVTMTVERAGQLGASEWLAGRGWDQNDWPVQEFPVHDALSAALPNTPVVLTRVDGHALLANRAAMREAGVDRNTPDPEGGRILRDSEGELTGVFIDTAEDLITRTMPSTSASQRRSAILQATQILHRQGITALHDAGVGQETLDVLFALEAEGQIRLRLHEMLDGSDAPLLKRYFASGPVETSKGKGLINVRAVKLYADGALGSRGAALLEPYTDDHHNHGLIITPTKDMRRVCDAALDAGFQVCTHAIGDRGVRQTLDAYEDSQAAHGSRAGEPRFRVEHAQVVHGDDFERFGKLGVIPSMQPQHQTSDMPWAEQRVGAERIRGAYAWRRFLEAGCIVPGGSDAPVERLNTVALFGAAVTRQTQEGSPAGGWYPDQVLTRQEALNMLTIWPAWAAFREHDLGRLAPGYRADLVVFEGDLMSVQASELKACHPVMTIFGGEVVWEK